MGLGLLSGCAVDKGSALAAGFDEDWAGTPDVAEVRTKGDNPLPFAGSAVGELVVADGTGADRVTQLVGELRGYVADHKNVTGRITADGITVTVVAEEERNTEALALWRSLAADDRVVDGDLAETTTGAVVRRRILVTVVDPVAVMDIFQDMMGTGGQHVPLAHTRSLAVRTDPKARPSLYVQTDDGGGVPEQGIAAYEAVRAEHDVVRATVRAHRETGSAVSIVVGPEADLAAAAKAARAAAPSLGNSVEVRKEPG
jgi:hypothetical protein